MAPKKNYTPAQMGSAIEAVRNGAKIAEAAQRYGVPRITLYNKVSGKSPIDCAMGPKTILSKYEEDILIKWLIGMSERHFPINRELLIESVQKIVTEQGRHNPFTNNKPGKKWFHSFLKRHPEITEKSAQNLSKLRDDVTEEAIRKWFSEIESYLDDNQLKDVLKEPSRIFNTDESAFFLSPKAGRVLCKSGEKHLYNFCGDEKDNLTVLITANAAGQLAPPLVVFKYERVPAHISASVPDDWGIGKSESGWMCGSTFYEYMTNIFSPWLEQNEIEKPVIFFLDGHKSHLTLHLSNFCSANGIEVIALYPNSTHILQPMDLAVFRPLKVSWRREVAKWQLDHIGQTLKKEHFAPVLKFALASISKDCIRNGFRAGGLHPFGPDYIQMNKIKHRQDPQKENNPRQTEFMQYLESQIIEVYSREKLKLFNDLYYKNRNTLEQTLPTEDGSLYVIWAKNKQTSISPALLAEKSSLQSEVSEANSLSSVAETSTKHLNQEKDSGNKELALLSTTTKSAVAFPDPVVDDADACEDYFYNTNFSSAENAPTDVTEKVNYREQILSPPANSELPSTSKSVTTINSSIYEGGDQNLTTDKFNSHLLASKNTQNPVFEFQSAQNNEQPSLNSEETFICSAAQAATPLKHRIESALGVVIPSPFKNNLFWPEEQKEKKKRKREKVPYTVTSKAWKDYHKKKQMEKEKKEEEKEERAKIRREKKMLKEKNNEKKKKRTSKSRSKIIHHEDTTPENTDLEVTYAESDDSILEEDNDITERSEMVQSKSRQSCEISREKRQIKRRRREVSDDTNSEEEPLSTLRRSLKLKSNIKVGQFVIVKYEGEFFPGKTEAIEEKQGQYEISTMILSTGNSFRWPEKADKIWYNQKDIVEIINEPVPLNKRGMFKIEEMQKYLPDLYNI